jgi:acyl-coenzyme A synthetase/AMP-(fatty) acid ligase
VQQGTATIVEAIRAPERSRAVALVDATGSFGELTYGELARIIADRGDELGVDGPSIVVLTGRNSVDWIVTYLALLDRGHVPLLAADATPHAIERIERQWSPAAVVTAGSNGIECRSSRDGRHRLHADLALLMSTSGSTGSPKLIRLSHRNLVANASAIAEFQRLTPSDRGITNLPLHYSLGLSVLHSHLVAGASVVVTGASVVDPCFADAVSEHAVTNLAGVPHTFELLEQVGPERLAVPTLRFLAQAGGRLAPDKVARWVERADSWGASWFTMYGQTEATARISYVPPESVAGHPGSIGRAIPGGQLTIVPTDDENDVAGVGELVYRGDNVMMGYALDPADLALGHELDELRTGDLARRDPESGLFEIVGRSARRVKPFGVRIDLDDVERQLAVAGVVADVTGDDDVLVAASTSVSDVELTEHLVAITGLPDAR